MPAINKNKKSILRYGWLLVLVPNIAVVLLLFLSVLAWWVSPAKTTIFAYLGLGFVFVVVANIIFIIFWLIFLKWRYALVSLIGLLLCISPILTYFPIHGKSKNIPEDSIKILSYNIRGFSWYEYKKDNNNPVLSYIRESNADIICLQEFLMIEDSKTINKKRIEEELKDYPYRSYVRLKSIYNSKNFLYGLACYSKYPILNTTKVPIESKDNAGSVLYKIKVKNKIISVFNNHLESNRLTSEDRKLYENLLSPNTDRAKLDDIAHNIRTKLGSAYVKRSVQADTLSSWIKKQKTDGVIVCGDFNDTPISYTYKTAKGDLKDSFAETGFGAGITYNENHFWFRIDYILHSPNFKSYNCTVDKVKYSDHYPVFTYLQLE